MTSSRVVCSLCVVALCHASSAFAQGWRPDKPIELVVGTTPGGPQDRLARTVQHILQDRKLIEVPIVVNNRAGGGGAVALAYINRHPGDAHYLYINATTLLTNHITGKSALGPDDVTPIATLNAEYVCVVVRADSALNGGNELIARLRAEPASLAVAVGTALGNGTHLSFALAMRAGGVDTRKLKTVVFGSASDSMTALLGGHIDAAASAPSSVLPHVKTGKLRVLAITAPQRLGGELAAVPTWKELGVDSAYGLWRGLAGPGKLTEAQVQFWDRALAQFAATPEWKKDLAANLEDDIYAGSAGTAKKWKTEYPLVKSVLVDLGLAK